MVYLVKDIHDWGDLIRGDVVVITTNPKTSAVARWSFLTACGCKMSKGDKQTETVIKNFVLKSL